MFLNDEIKNANIYNIYTTLEEDYPEILDSILSEKYEIEYPDYFHFEEIVFEGEVVGFVTFELLNYYSRKLCINEYYILPEYRSIGIMGTYLIESLLKPNLKLYLRKPSKSLIAELLKMGLAFKLTENIVVSYIDFLVEVDDRFVSKKIKKYYRQISQSSPEYAHISRMYDFNLGSVIYRDSPAYYPRNDDVVMISKPRSVDLDESSKKLEKVRPSYLKNLADKIFLGNEEKSHFEEVIKNRLDSLLDVDKVIGDEDNLLETVRKKLLENNLTVEDGFKFRKEIINALGEGEIKPVGISTRFNYLMGEIQKVREDGLNLKCPHCGYRIEFYSDTCPVCGHDLSNNGVFKEVNLVITEFSKDIASINSRGDPIPIGKNIYCKLLEWIKKNGYDYHEVYEAQCEYVAYCCMKDIKPKEYRFAAGSDSFNFIREGSALVYAINHDYIEGLTEERYRYELENNYSTKDVRRELYDYGIEFKSDDKEELIKKIFEDEWYTRFFDDRFVLTEKGKEFLKDEMLNYCYNEFPDNYVYYDFKRLWLEYRNQLSLDEIMAKFLDESEKLRSPRFSFF